MPSRLQRKVHEITFRHRCSGSHRYSVILSTLKKQEESVITSSVTSPHSTDADSASLETLRPMHPAHLMQPMVRTASALMSGLGSAESLRRVAGFTGGMHECFALSSGIRAERIGIPPFDNVDQHPRCQSSCTRLMPTHRTKVLTAMIARSGCVLA